MDILKTVSYALSAVFVVVFVTLYYLTIKKCFWKGGRSRIGLFVLTLLTNPLLSYFATVVLSSFFVTLVAYLNGDLEFSDVGNLSYMILIYVIGSIIYLVMLFLSSHLIAKWLNTPNKSLVTFVALMYSVLFMLSLRNEIINIDGSKMIGYVVDIIGTIIIFIAMALLYGLVITALSGLTDRQREINDKLFIFPPTIFCLFYCGFVFSSDQFNDSDSSLLIYFFSTVILFLFIWAFYVIIKNINATNEALAAKDIAAAVERINADLAVAKAIQSSVLPNVFPPFPERKEFELFADMNTAKEVGGDFYDFYMLNDSTLGFIIADVSGKSIPGAMFMMTSKTVIKSLAESGLPPAEVFTLANEKLCEGNDAEMFVTAWLGYLDLKTGEVRVANAGHNPPLLIRDGNAEFVVLRSGLVLAGINGFLYKEQTLKMQRGDVLYLYTDGVTEAINKDEEEYGNDRLRKLLSFGQDYPSPSDKNGIVGAICQKVSGDIAEFTDGAEQSDDITMLCIRYLGQDPE